MSYTNKDLDNGIAYSNNRYKLKVINALYKKLPHLTSHLEYSIEQADPDVDYYYPASFASKAIRVSTNIPEKLCSKLSCNSIMSESSCKRSTVASYYIVGDQANFQRQCEPACYNLLEDPVIDEETGEEQVQMLRLEYNDTFGCVFLPTAYAWHEHPFYRSDVVYEHRLNDLPAGFNRADPDPYSYSGLTYEYNKSYCDAYFDDWSESKRTCTEKWWETVLYAVVGESIIKLVKAGIQNVNNGYKSDYPPVEFPEIPIIEELWTVDGWKKDINKDFILPPEDYEIPSTKTIQRETFNNNDQNIVEKFPYMKRVKFIKNIKSKQRQIGSNLRRKLETFYDIKLTSDEHDKIQKIKDTNRKYPTIRLINKRDGSEDSILDVLTGVLTNIMEGVFDSKFWIDMGLGITSDVILTQIKVIFRKLANDILPKLTEKILAYSGKMLTEVFAKTLYATIANTMSKLVIKTVSKVMIQLTKLMAEIASVVGIILAIISIFDILLSIWDPVGFNNKFDKDILDSVTRSSDIALRQSLEVAIPSMTFEIFTNICLTSNEILDNSLSTFVYIYEYLDSLTVNSEGSRINKGNEINFDDMDDSTVNKTIVTTKLVTPKEIYDYENEHNQRMQFYTISMTITITLLVISVLFMILDIWFMALVFFILVILSAIVQYLNGTTLNVGKLIKDSSILQSLIP